MPGLPALLRLAGALGMAVESFAAAVYDPAEEELEAPPERPRRRGKEKTM